MADAKQVRLDPLARDDVYPEATAIFEFAPVSLDECFTNSIIVLDTSALIVPYGASTSSFSEIAVAYERLATAGRLRIPGQAAREFADLRPEKFKEVHSQLTAKRSQITSPRSSYPILEGTEPYRELRRVEEQLAKQLREYQRAIDAVVLYVERLRWDDPVSGLYRRLFDESVITELDESREALLAERDRRYANRIPPGYKDAGNESSGIGDLLIWLTILRIGKDTRRDVVFVSGDEKTDWRYQSNKKALYPRFELLDEFRRASGGKSLHIISLAELLNRMGAPDTVVEEVRQEEASSAAQAALKMSGTGVVLDEGLTVAFDSRTQRASGEVTSGEMIPRRPHAMSLHLEGPGFEISGEIGDLYHVSALDILVHNPDSEIPLDMNPYGFSLSQAAATVNGVRFPKVTLRGLIRTTGAAPFPALDRDPIQTSGPFRLSGQIKGYSLERGVAFPDEYPPVFEVIFTGSGSASALMKRFLLPGGETGVHVTAVKYLIGGSALSAG